MRISDFQVLTFDCYGTLIDWETGLLDTQAPLARRAGLAAKGDVVLEMFARHETAQQAETPELRYSDLLAAVYERLAGAWGVKAISEEAEAFGRSVPVWPAFPDSAGALAYLKQHFKLVILSNVDRQSFAGSNESLGVEFDAILTAEDIGSYKPDVRNFEYMLAAMAELGYRKADILHTAQSLYHDMVPAKSIGLATAWIDRRHDQVGWGATAPPPQEVQTDFRFDTMAALVRQHQNELALK